MNLLIIIFSISSLWAKPWCSPTELNLKNCSVSFRQLKLHIHGADTRVNNSVWNHVRDLKELKTTKTWQSLGLRSFSNRVFLQAKVWKASNVLDSIEHLQWLLWEVDGTELHLKVNEVIQKRKRVSDEKYITDPLEKHGVKIKNGKLIWWYKTTQNPLN